MPEASGELFPAQQLLVGEDVSPKWDVGSLPSGDQAARGGAQLLVLAFSSLWGWGEHEEAAQGLCSGFGTLLLVPVGWVLERLAHGAWLRPANQHLCRVGGFLGW